MWGNALSHKLKAGERRSLASHYTLTTGYVTKLHFRQSFVVYINIYILQHAGITIIKNTLNGVHLNNRKTVMSLVRLCHVQFGRLHVMTALIYSLDPILTFRGINRSHFFTVFVIRMALRSVVFAVRACISLLVRWLLPRVRQHSALSAVSWRSDMRGAANTQQLRRQNFCSRWTSLVVLSSGPAAQSRHHLRTVQTTAERTPFRQAWTGALRLLICGALEIHLFINLFAYLLTYLLNYLFIYLFTYLLVM